jgi:hypothetical protein
MGESAHRLRRSLGCVFWGVPGDNGAKDRKLIDIRAELAKKR